jgi:hypothetical protein
MLKKQVDKMRSEEFKKEGLTIFDIALLLKVSTPAAEFDKTIGKGVMRETLQMIYDYMSTIILGDDLDRIYGEFVFEQLQKFDENIAWYLENWKDNFSDYIDDLMQIACNDIENKGLYDIQEKAQELMEASMAARG